MSHRIETGTWEGAGQAALNGAVQGAIDGAMSGAISGAITGAFTSPYCFVAGTAILTGAGYVAIENIKVGDIVWSTNPDTGETALKEVLRTYVNETDELVHVTVDGEEIVTTPSHPFYVPKQGWTDAIHLKAGDILLTVNGEYVVVEKVQHELLEAPVTVYNFEVEDFHTYYVGDGVLVHNACGDIGPYNQVSKNKVSGNEAHHILEKRFAPQFKLNPRTMPSIELTHQQHLEITNKFRKYLPYGEEYGTDKIMSALKKIYSDNEELLNWAIQSILGG